MTLYGFDISNNNGPNLSIAEIQREGFAWCEAKVSEGDYFSDPDWQGYRDQANACGLPIIGYHYAVSSCPPVAQAAKFAAAGGGPVVMIDFEDRSGTIADYRDLVRAFNAIGVTVAATYLPQWYWSQIGSPDLSQVPGLIASAYPMSSAGYASVLYQQDGGDSGDGWRPYGNGSPVMWQFTDCALVGGQTVDANAFRGSVAELTALLNGGDMDLNTPITNGAGATVDVGFMMAATDYHGSMALDELCGPGTSNTVGGTLVPTGHSQLGNRTLVNAIAKIGAHLAIPGFVDPDGAQS